MSLKGKEDASTFQRRDVICIRLAEEHCEQKITVILEMPSTGMLNTLFEVRVDYWKEEHREKQQVD